MPINPSVSAAVIEVDNNTTAETAAIDYAGENSLLVAFVSSSASSPLDPTESRWGGAGGTLLTKQGATTDVGPFAKSSAYSLVAPLDELRAIYALWAGNQDEAAIAAAIFIGVDATLGAAPTATTGTLGAAPSITVATQAGDVVVAGCWLLDTIGGSPIITSDVGQTNLQKLDNGTPSIYNALALDYKVASGASTTISWTLSAPGPGASSPDNIVQAFLLRPSSKMWHTRTMISRRRA